MRPKNVDDIPDSAIGGNPSENPDEEDPGATGGATASTGETEINVVADYRLVETGFDKKGYQVHLKV